MYDEMDRAAELTVVFREDDGCEITIEYDNEDPTAGPVATRSAPPSKWAKPASGGRSPSNCPVRFANRA